VSSRKENFQCRVSRKLVDAAALVRELLLSAVPSHETMAARFGFQQKTSHSVEHRAIKEVFVSYAWADDSTAIIDKLQQAFKGRDVVLVRDKNEVKYKDSIRDFMKRIGQGKCIVVVLTKKYLELKNYMFEMTEIADRGDIRNRVFPIVLEDAKIYDASGRLRYIKFWEQKKRKLDAQMKGVSGEYLQGIREELNLFAKIRGTIA
jgi:internalin A